MNLELILIPAIFLLSLWLLFSNFRVAVGLLLVLSLFLHKELFSVYRWDVLPVRIFMLAVLVYSLIQVFLFFSRPGTYKDKLASVKKFFRDPFILLLSLLWFVQGISIIFTKNFQASILLFSFFTTILCLGLLLYTHFKDDTVSVLKYIHFYIFLVFAACVFGFVQLYVFHSTATVIGAMWPVPGNIPRVGSVFWDINHFGGLIAALLPVLGIFVLTDTGWKKKIFNAAMFLVMFGILLLTNSRTAWMATFFSFIIFMLVLLYRKFRLKGVIFLVLTLVILTIPILYEYSDKSSTFRRHVKDYFHYRIDSFDSHILLLRGSVAVFKELPVLGGGYGGFYEHFSKTDVAAEYFGRDPAALNTRVPAHTIWGEQLSETGIVGLAAFLLLVILILTTLFYAALTLSNRTEVLLSTAMGSAILGLLIAGIFYSYKSEFFWLVVFFYFIYGVSIVGHRFDASHLIWRFTRSDKLPLLLITVIAGVLIFANLGTNHLIPWDEAIYAKIAKNSLLSGKYLELRWITTSDLPWFEKPPLYMWFVSAAMRFLGYTSLAVRLPSAIFGFLTVIVTFYFGKKLSSRLGGFMSAFVLVTTFQFLYYARTGMLDVTATFFITLALYLYWLAKERINEKRELVFWLLTGVAIGFAVMVKGVVGFLPLPVIGLYELYLLKIKEQPFTKKLIRNYLYLVGACILVFLPWHLEMYRRFGSSFLSNYIGYHVIERATSAIEDKGRPFLWYLTVTKVSMRLWFIALLFALPLTVLMAFFGNLKDLKGKVEFTISPKNYTFLLIYAVVFFIFFSVAKSKLVWYIMPLYPALAIMVGLFFARVIETVSKGSLVRKFLLVYVLVIIGIGYLVVKSELVYTSDLTGKQAQLLMLKDEVFGSDEKVYADRIELPLILFYSDGPYSVVDYGPLKEILSMALPTQRIVFITKESRYSDFDELWPRIKLIKQIDEWVLAELPPSSN